MGVTFSECFVHLFIFRHCLRTGRDPLTIYYLIWAPITNLGYTNFN